MVASNNFDELEWFCFGESVKGATHKRKGLPNQDDIDFYPPSSETKATSLPLVLAVADGHGSSKCFRSDIGSRLAVQAAITVIREEILTDCNLQELFRPERLKYFQELEVESKKRLPQRIVQEWKKEVEKHWQENPLKSAESAYKQQKTNENFYLAYGSTLLSVIVTQYFILYLQLGDGDIFCIDAEGEPYRPLLEDEKLIANETTSLCTKDAWGEFRSCLKFYPEGNSEEMPVLILLATDGYGNSFPSDRDFLNIAREYRQMIHEAGIERVKQELPEFLNQTSSEGSGDDITLGILGRIEKDAYDSVNNYTKTMTITTQTQAGQVQDQSNNLKKKLDNIHQILLITLLTSLLSAVSVPFTFLSLRKISSLETQVGQLQETEADTLENQTKYNKKEESVNNFNSNSGELKDSVSTDLQETEQDGKSKQNIESDSYEVDER